MAFKSDKYTRVVDEHKQAQTWSLNLFNRIVMTPVTLRYNKTNKLIEKLKFQYQFYRQHDNDHRDFRATNEFKVRIEDLPRFIEGIQLFLKKHHGTSNTI